MKLKGIKKPISIALILMVLVGGAVANVAAYSYYKSYPSYIKISTQSTLTGQERKYSGTNYTLKLTPAILRETSPYGYSRLNVRLIRPLYRLGINYGSETRYNGHVNLYEVGKTYTIDIGNKGDGKRYFFFASRTADDAWGSVSADAEIINYTN